MTIPDLYTENETVRSKGLYSLNLLSLVRDCGERYLDFPLERSDHHSDGCSSHFPSIHLESGSLTWGKLLHHTSLRMV